MKAIYFLVIFIFAISFFLVSKAHGDGLASEILPPSLIGKINVTLSIGSTPFLIDNNHAGTQLNLVLMDASTQQPIPDATLAVSAFKGQDAVFGHIFKSDSGNFVLSFYPQQSGNTTFDEQGGVISGLFGQDSGNYDVKGPVFNSGGLYRFKIEVITMGAYDNQVSKSYNAGISIPEYDNLTINDPTYGTQRMQIIAYYDQLHNITYDPAKKFVNFTMPFDWSVQNISQLTVVHQEIRIPRTLGDFVVTKYDAYANNIKIPDKLISIDDYSMDAYRIVHIILYKPDVENLFSEQKDPSQEMTFAMKPSNEDNFPIVQFTRNAQYKIALSWDPPKIASGSTTQFNFKILDPYTMNKTVSPISYDFSVLEGKNGVIYHQVGRTSGSDSGDNINVAFPSNYTGAITVAFENLNGSSFSATEFPSTVNSPSMIINQTAAINQTTVPEFPLAAIVTLAAVFGLSISLSEMNLLRLKQA
ncbi:MAG: hypothetical protein KGI08_06650 [Thaumarchaeota archaeon]|nr:hypothetical protein [Nitrososphaerota archaeon]